MRGLLHAIILMLAMGLAWPVWPMDGMGGIGGNECASVCVGYSVAAQGVPLSPSAMALMTVILGVAGMALLRRRLSRNLGILLAGGLSALLLLPQFDLAKAGNAPVATIYLSSGNPATPEVFTNPGGYLVTNNLQQVVSITSIASATGFAIDLDQTTCHLGMRLEPANSCLIVVVYSV